MKSNLKSKIIKRASVKKPSVKPVVNRAKTIKKEEVFDLSKIKSTRVEWFDDRFYKLALPLNIDPSYISGIPENFIDSSNGDVVVYLPSVSTIKSNAEPKPYLATWRGDVGNQRADQITDIALRKGSNIHNAIDLLVNGTDIIYQNLKTKNITNKEISAYRKKRKRPVLLIHQQEEMIQVARFQRLINILQPKILSAEQSVFNLQECYAGTLDQVWDLPGGTYDINSSRTKTTIEPGLYIIDFKTGKGYDESSTYIQLSAYLEAHHMKDKIRGAIGIHLNNDNKTGINGVKIYLRYKEDLLNYYEQFLTYKKIFFYTNQIFPKTFEVPMVITMQNKIKKGVLK